MRAKGKEGEDLDKEKKKEAKTQGCGDKEML